MCLSRTAGHIPQISNVRDNARRMIAKLNRKLRIQRLYTHGHICEKRSVKLQKILLIDLLGFSHFLTIDRRSKYSIEETIIPIFVI